MSNKMDQNDENAKRHILMLIKPNVPFVGRGIAMQSHVTSTGVQGTVRGSLHGPSPTPHLCTCTASIYGELPHSIDDTDIGTHFVISLFCLHPLQ